MTASKIGRRTILAGGAVTLAGVTVAGAQLSRARVHTPLILQDILERNLPEHLLSKPEVRKFVQAYQPKFLSQYYSDVRKDWLMARLTSRKDARIELIEREVLTEFLIGSDFFEPGRPPDRPIKFDRLRDVCVNPFRRT